MNKLNQDKIGWYEFPKFIENPDGRVLKTSAELLKRHGYDHLASQLNAWAESLLTSPILK